MTEQEQVRFIAEKIMNWALWRQRPMEVDEYPYVECRDDELIIWPRWGSHGKTWDPRTSIADAVQVMDKLSESFAVQLNSAHPGWSFEVMEHRTCRIIGKSLEDTACRAIFVGAIQTVQAGDAR